MFTSEVDFWNWFREDLQWEIDYINYLNDICDEQESQDNDR